MTSGSTVANPIIQLQDSRAEGLSSNPYVMFKFSTRSVVTRKYYERRIRHFFDFIKFDLENKDKIEKRCNAFALEGVKEIKWAIEQVVRFLQFQKDRVERGEITAATLRNYVKSLKLFCASAK